jgi:hypothetical protein
MIQGLENWGGESDLAHQMQDEYNRRRAAALAQAQQQQAATQMQQAKTHGQGIAPLQQPTQALGAYQSPDQAMQTPQSQGVGFAPTAQNGAATQSQRMATQYQGQQIAGDAQRQAVNSQVAGPRTIDGDEQRRTATAAAANAAGVRPSVDANQHAMWATAMGPQQQAQQPPRPMLQPPAPMGRPMQPQGRPAFARPQMSPPGRFGTFTPRRGPPRF